MLKPFFDLEFERVSKIYRITEPDPVPAGNSIKGLWKKMTRKPTEFRAVNDVSFQVPKGQALGIIGHNGAGKSTILKLLSKITTPTNGEIRIAGRIASLLEVGSGFHPELTGRENIYLCGSILGMRRAEITKKLDAIVDFSEVRKFIDVPTKRYSSGMYVRLGFSIAAHLEADVLLLDEVLAVGDAAFQDRCLTRIEDLRRAGVTIVFISHDLNSVRRLCERVLVMNGGCLVFDGKAEEATRVYMESARFSRTTVAATDCQLPGRITQIQLMDQAGRSTPTFRTGSEMRVRVHVRIEETMAGALIQVWIYDMMRQCICQLKTSDRGTTLDPGEYSIDFCCPELPLQPGVYSLDAALEVIGDARPGDVQQGCASIWVEGGPSYGGVLFAPHTTQITQVETGADRILSDNV